MSPGNTGEPAMTGGEMSQTVLAFCMRRSVRRARRSWCRLIPTRRIERREAVTRTRAVACVAAGFEFAARRWPPFVDRAARTFADAAHERCAARARVVRPAHPAGGRRDLDREAFRHASALRFRFLRGEVHAEACAARPTNEARVFPVNRHLRQRPRRSLRWRRAVYGSQLCT